MDGLVLADKPAGKTSHDLVVLVRRGLGERRAGHAGTLDPFATGLLLVLVGRGRRIQRFVMALPKTYEAVARFGAVSTTGDPEGEITTTGVVPEGPLRLPTGRLRQRPPAYSAVHVDGRRAYERARAGEDVVVPEREVVVHRFEQLWREGDRAGLLDRVLVGDLRPQRSSPTWATPTARSCGAPRSGRSGVAGRRPAPRRRRSPRRCAFLPSVALDPATAPAGRASGRPVEAPASRPAPSTSCSSTTTGRSRSPSPGRAPG